MGRLTLCVPARLVEFFRRPSVGPTRHPPCQRVLRRVRLADGRKKGQKDYPWIRANRGSESMRLSTSTASQKRLAFACVETASGSAAIPSSRISSVHDARPALGLCHGPLLMYSKSLFNCLLVSRAGAPGGREPACPGATELPGAPHHIRARPDSEASGTGGVVGLIQGPATELSVQCTNAYPCSLVASS